MSGKPWQKGFDPRRKIFTPEERQRGLDASNARNRRIFEATSFEDLSSGLKAKRVLEEQNGICLHCGLNKWNDKLLTLEIDHVDGDGQNEVRENLRYLCPNCHSQTPTWRKKKSSFSVRI